MTWMRNPKHCQRVLSLAWTECDTNLFNSGNKASNRSGDWAGQGVGERQGYGLFLGNCEILLVSNSRD